MSIRMRLFTALVVLGELSEKLSRAFLFLGVGILRRADLADVSRRSWSAFGQSDTQVQSGLNAWEQAAYLPFVTRGARVCIVGCGSGRLVLPFLDAGHDVVGVEPSPEPVARLQRTLRERGQHATVIEARIEDAVLPGAFDLILFSLNCYGYVQGTAARIAVLKKLAAHLSADGRIFVSYPRRRGDWANRSARLTMLAARLTRSDWRIEPYDSLLRLDVPGEPGAVIFEHFFEREDIEREAGQAGLRICVDGDPWATPYAVLGRAGA
jgi:SAM-dependent methyltransferase